MDSAADHSAVFFDGRSNRKRAVTLRFASGLDIVEQDAVVETWPYEQVRRADGPPGMLRLSCTKALPLARLEMSDAATIGAVAAYCRSLGAGAPSARHTWQGVFWSVAAACSILLLTFYGIPYAADRLAPVLPFAIEKRVGEAIDKQARLVFGGRTCERADGQAAFAKLVERLKTAGGIDRP